MAAENFNSMLGLAMAGMAIYLGIGLAIYIYTGVTMMIAAGKLGVSHGWMAFIPIANLVLLVRMSGLSMWTLLLAFVPFGPLVWFWKINEHRGLPKPLAFLMIFPVLNLIYLGLLAWAGNEHKEAEPRQEKPHQEPQVESQEPQEVSDYSTEAVNYVKSMMQSGFSRSQIKDRLVSGGWEEDQAEGLLGAINTSNQ